MSKEILFIISDQHAYKVQGNAGNTLVRTPNLDRLAAAGTVMRNSYAACPLCVPSRLSMLTGQFPSRLKALTNDASLDSEIPTFVHSLNAGGYETTLCGRMHFVGPDQRHGFIKRLVGDITPTTYGRRQKKIDTEALPWNRGRIEHLAIRCMGGGDSTVLAFDRDVTDAAVAYLGEDHQAPQFLCVGLYAPHFPYIAPKELFDYYYDRVQLPTASYQAEEHPIFERKLRDTEPETVRGAMAAYYGMTEFLDNNIGRILEAWEKYLKRTGREGMAVYVSDHGDSHGEHGFYGKNTFFESSVHVPMIFAGSGIPAGREIESPVSLLDISPTLCQMAGTVSLPRQDGESLAAMICGEERKEDRVVFSELSNRFGPASIGRMAKWKQYKYVTFSGFEGEDQLFDVEADPWETQNRFTESPEIVSMLSHAVAAKMKDPRLVLAELEARRANMEILSQCRQDPKEEWQAAAGAAQDPPVPMVASKIRVSFL